MHLRRKPGYRPEPCRTRQRIVQRARGDPGAQPDLIMRQPLLALALSAVFLAPAQAETLPQFVGETIVVTATRTPQPLAAPLQHTSVITRADIEASTAPDLPTLLRRESGVEITSSGGLGAQSALRIRGSEADQVLVLIDGVRVGSVSAGTTAIDQIMLDEVDRVEIVRGNVSSVYGSEAIGGVVQVFTRRGAGPTRASATLGVGSDDTRKLALSIGGEAGATRFHFGAAHTRSDGFSSADPAFVPTPWTFAAADDDDDAYRNTTLNLALSQRLAAGHELGLTAFRSSGDIEFDGSLQNASKQTLTALNAYSENRWHPDWLSRIQLSQGSDDLTASLDGVPTDRFRTRNRQIDWDNTVNAGPGTLRIGLAGLWQRLESDAAFARDARRVASVTTGYTASLGAHDVQFNLRRDDYSDFGGATTALAGYGYRVTPRARVSASVSNAFRAPSFNDLYGPYGGNPDLDAERATNGELGFTYSSARGLARITAFATRTRDLIDFDPLSWLPVNVDEAENRGVEFSWRGTLAGFDTRAAATVQNPEDRGTGLGLLRRADRFGSVSLGRTHGAFDWQTEILASGPRPDIHVATYQRIVLPGYAVLNLSLGWKPARDWRLRTKLTNLLDKDYALVHGYATQGRAAFIELAYVPK